MRATVIDHMDGARIHSVETGDTITNRVNTLLVIVEGRFLVTAGGKFIAAATTLNDATDHAVTWGIDNPGEIVWIAGPKMKTIVFIA